ncbi:MAG: glycosyltransferase family 2 protein [Anaerolineae bacterium]|nr:glycosyltransferase family 2 protein [Anaerolineae bacterium]
MRDLAVLVVTWNVRELVLTALRTLLEDLAASGLGATVHLVDCASSDGTAQAVAEMFPEVDLVASEKNLGFAAGNNLLLRRIGFRDAAGSVAGSDDLPRAVYLLNPDTATHPGATQALFEALMSDPRRGFAGAQLSYGDGRFQPSAFAFPGLRQLWVEFFPTPGRMIEGTFNGRYPHALYERGEPFDVDCVLGAAMMVRRESIQAAGLLDERFFMYCEEIDWAWRITRAGFHGVCTPGASVVHYVGQSTGQARPRSIVNLWTSRLLLYSKHYPRWKNRVARWMIARGMGRLRRRAGSAEIAAAYDQVRAMAARTE